MLCFACCCLLLVVDFGLVWIISSIVLCGGFADSSIASKIIKLWVLNVYPLFLGNQLFGAKFARVNILATDLNISPVHFPISSLSFSAKQYRNPISSLYSRILPNLCPSPGAHLPKIFALEICLPILF